MPHTRHPHTQGPPQQSAVPSQYQRERTPYSSQARVGGPVQPPPGPAGQPPSNAYVLTTYDARPVSALDIVRFEVEAIGGGRVRNTFVVPEGYVLTIRNIAISAYPDANDETPYDPTLSYTNRFGFPEQTALELRMDLQVDGVSNPNLSNLLIQDAVYGDVDFDCYVQADAGQTVTIMLTLTSVNDAALNDAYIAIRGNLLNKTGRELTSEPTPTRAVPVIDGSSM